MQKNFNWATLNAVLLIIVILGGIYGMTLIPKNVPTQADTDTAIAEAVNQAAADIVANLPEAPVIDTTTEDRICELTNGCEFWEPKSQHVNAILNRLDNPDAKEDFKEAFGDLVGLEWDEDLPDTEIAYGNINDNGNLDSFYEEDDNGIGYQIKASTKDYPVYKVNNDWEIKVFLRVEYYDTDDDDEKEIAYVVVTSTLDEGDYEDLTVEKVDRHFEFI